MAEALVGTLDRGVRAPGDAVGAVAERRDRPRPVGAARRSSDRGVALLDGVEVAGDGLDERAGARRRRLQRRVGDLVGDAAVDLVAEAGEHRHRRGGDGPGDRLGVERGQLVAGAAATDDDDDVEAAPAGVVRERTDRPADRAATPPAPARGCRRARAGTRSRCAPARRGSRATPRCRRWRRRRRAAAPRLSGRRPVGVERAVGGQPAQHLVALLGEVAEREPRVEVGHLQPELAARRVEVEVAEDAHLHAVGEAQAVRGEQRAQALAGVGEELHAQHGLAPGRVVGEGEVGVAAALAPPLDLAAHPDPVAEPAAQRRVDGVGELATVNVGLAASSSASSPKSNAGSGVIVTLAGSCACQCGASAPLARATRQLARRCRGRPSVGEQLAVDGEVALDAQVLELLQRAFEGTAARAGELVELLLHAVEVRVFTFSVDSVYFCHCWPNLPISDRISSLVCSIMKLSNAWRMTPRKANSVSGEHITTRWRHGVVEQAGVVLVDEPGELLVGQEQQHVVDRRPVALARRTRAWPAPSPAAARRRGSA